MGVALAVDRTVGCGRRASINSSRVNRARASIIKVILTVVGAIFHEGTVVE